MISILTVVVGAVGAYYHLDAAIVAHCANAQAHHSQEFLDGVYVTRKEYQVMQAQLDRIEGKQDQLIQMHMAR